MDDPSKFPLSASISGTGLETITIDAPSIRVDELPNRGVWTNRITFSGLSAWTGYVYSVTQKGQTIQGSFQTLPADQTTPFSFIMSTCDGSIPRNPTNTFRTIRHLVETSTIPVVHMLHIDDVHYADTDDVNDSVTGLVSTGKPENTGVGADYAKAWTANYGLLPSESKWMLPDRQWVYQNLPCCYSGGDHAIAGNWCRGDAKPGAGDRMHKPCDRGPGGLEEVAAAEWDAFYGNINPTPLRPGQWYWGKDMGPVRLSLWDMSKTIEPYNSRYPTDTSCYGPRQISDHMNFLDTSTHPFKIALHESGLTKAGQPWLEYHRTEAEAWLSDFRTRPNLNGTAGNFVSLYGDNHAVHTLKLDDFWAWCPGTLGDSQAVGTSNFANLPWGWGGIIQYADTSAVTNGDRFLHDFLLVTVRGDKTPAYIDIAHIDGGRGIVKYAARLNHLSPQNQMVML